MKKKQIFIRSDANYALGTGHIMRCLSIANALLDVGYQVTFLTADHNADGLLTGKNVGHVCLNSQWDDLEQELGLLEQLLQEQRPDFLIVDHYYVTERYLLAVKKYAKDIYIDDLRAFLYPCNILINYNAYALDWEAEYRKDYENFSTLLLLGSRYVPLREEFQVIPPKQIRPVVEDVLVSTGGADPVNMAGQLMNVIANTSEWDGIKFHFVMGVLNPRYASLKETASKLSNVAIHFNVSNMSELMQKCDIAIAAAGGTLYELCACGVPTITYVLADNQIQNANTFASLGIMENIGDIRFSDDYAKYILNRVNNLSYDVERRTKMSKEMKKCVDGNGAKRIADFLKKYE